MKILVFDDSSIHREAAQAQLGKDHDLTVVGTYYEAQDLLISKCNYEKVRAILKDQFGDFSPYRSDDEVKKAEYFANEKILNKQNTTHPNFDVVMTDLLVPASDQAQGREGMKFVGKEMPLGTIIALLALTNGIKNVAVVTDTNHHHHPASAAFDHFGGCKLTEVKIFCMNRVGKVAIDSTTRELVSADFLKSEEGKQKYPEDPITYDRKGIVWGKDWSEVLTRFLK